jgi:hypothetical protein
LQASDAPVSLEMLDRENSPLTSPFAVTGLTDTAELFKRVHPHGSERRLLRLRTDLLSKLSTVTAIRSSRQRGNGKGNCDNLEIARRRLPGPRDLFSF